MRGVCRFFVWGRGYENVASALHYCWKALRVPSFPVAAQYAYRDLFTFDSMSWGSFPLRDVPRTPQLFMYVDHVEFAPNRNSSYVQMPVCVTYSVAVRCGIWVKVCRAFTWLKARVLSRGRYLYYHTLHEIDGWTEGCFVWFATKSNEVARYASASQFTQLAPAAHVLAASVTGYTVAY